MKPGELRRLIRPGIAGRLGVRSLEEAYRVALRVKYTPADFLLEFFNTPERTLRRLRGDCDDIAILLTSLLRGLGYNAYVRIILLPDGSYHAFTFIPPTTALDPTVSRTPRNVYHLYMHYTPVLDFNDREVRIYVPDVANRILIKTIILE